MAARLSTSDLTSVSGTNEREDEKRRRRGDRGEEKGGEVERGAPLPQVKNLVLKTRVES